jgi:type VI secretion system protein ImpH
MAGEDRAKARALVLYPALQKTPYNFDFFQAIRQLECVHPGLSKVGYSIRPDEDPVYLGQDPSMVFAPSTLSSLTLSKNQGKPRLGTFFFGLLGPNGPLPLHLTEYAHDRLINGHDSTFARFLDVFNHRMLCLFYRAWADVRPAVSFDRPDEDRFGFKVGALFGIGMESLRNRDSIPDVSKLFFSGLFACQTRHPEGLVEIIKEYFKVPAELEEFVGEWMSLPSSSRCYLNRLNEFNQLGQTAVLGMKVWGCQQKFRICIGPVDFSDFQSFLPESKSLESLVMMVKNYIGDELNWDLKMILKRGKIPSASLGGQGRLGWTCWLGNRNEFTYDEALYFSPLNTRLN